MRAQKVRALIHRVYRRHRPSRRASKPLPGSPGSIGCCVAYNEHGAYCVPLSSAHRPAAQRILAGRVWETSTLALLCDEARRGDVVHAGTYFGDFVPALARACRSERLVWAFEPNLESFRCAELTIRLNVLANVKLMNAALSDQQGDLLLETSDDKGVPLGGMSRIGSFRETVHPDQVSTVRGVALDAVVPQDRTVAAIHLDVEGHEQQALSGSLETIKRNLPVLVVESMPTAEWVDVHLAPLGYRRVRRVESNTVLTRA